jgi:hypothetical protein
MEHLIEPIRPYGMLLAGGLFGAGWWAWCDVLLRSSLVLHTKVSPLYCIPGIVATVAVILMAVISREDTDGYIGYEDDGEQVGKAVDAEACSIYCGMQGQHLLHINVHARCTGRRVIAASITATMNVRTRGCFAAPIESIGKQHAYLHSRAFALPLLLLLLPGLCSAVQSVGCL